MTDTESRLLAAGDALADALSAMLKADGSFSAQFAAAEASCKMAQREWRALAREVRKEKGDDAPAPDS